MFVYETDHFSVSLALAAIKLVLVEFLREDHKIHTYMQWLLELCISFVQPSAYAEVKH